MRSSHALLGLALGLATAVPAIAAQGTITWHDPSCGFFVMSLPEGPAERFGLFSWRSGTDPSLDQVWEGNIVDGEDMDIVNVSNGLKMTVIHWANAKEQAQLVRNTPVQCASKWKKKK